MRTTIIAAALATACLCAPALAESNIASQQSQAGQPGVQQNGPTTNNGSLPLPPRGDETTGRSTGTPARQPGAAASQGDAGMTGRTSANSSNGANPSAASGHNAGGSSQNASQNATSQGNAGNQVHYVTNNNPDLWSAEKLDGVNVYNDENKEVGTITDVLVDRNGQVKAVVIGVGGFLGIGEHDVAVSFNSLQWQMTRNNNPNAGKGSAAQTNGSATATASDGANAGASKDKNRDAPARAILAGATKDSLTNAPEFKYAH